MTPQEVMPVMRCRCGTRPAELIPDVGMISVITGRTRVLPVGLFPQDRACHLRERPTAGDRCEPLDSDGVWTKRGPKRPRWRPSVAHVAFHPLGRKFRNMSGPSSWGCHWAWATSPSRRLVASPVAALARPPRRRPSRSARPPRRRSSRRVRRRLRRSSKWPRRPSGRPSKSARPPWRPAARQASRRTVQIRPRRAVDNAANRHRAAQLTRPPAAPSVACVVRNPRTTTASSPRALWCFRWTGEWGGPRLEGTT